MLMQTLSMNLSKKNQSIETFAYIDKTFNIFVKF
jgi:hypothetical protein